jgi:hypothetical protein
MEVEERGVVDGIVACPGCGEVNDLATERLAVLQQDVENLERELRSKRARIKHLQADQAAVIKAHPLYQDAQDVLEHWREKCMPGARDLNGPRLKNTIGMLALKPKPYTVEELKRCADGYALKPYVVNGRRSASGSHDDWYADAELIYRDDKHVQAGLQLKAAHEAMQQALSEPEQATPASAPLVTAQTPYGARIARYANSLGFAVFPCAPNQKVPATRNGFQDATKDQERIMRCWNTRPDLNVGVATGAVSGIVVIDVDDYKGGGDSLADLESRYGKFPKTLSATTPRGGQHFYFRHPGAHTPNAVEIVDGIDVRGDGGYVLVPPSVVDGKPYEWDERTCIADMPDWLVRGLSNRRSEARSATYWIDLAQGVAAGQRNIRMTELVGKMVGHGLADDLVATLAMAVNEKFKPPLDQKELSTIVRSIIGRHKR